MSALSNVDTRRGGDKPSSAGPISCISPEVQSHLTENSNTGVSVNCVPEGKKVWIVFVINTVAQLGCVWKYRKIPTVIQSKNWQAKLL